MLRCKEHQKLLQQNNCHRMFANSATTATAILWRVTGPEAVFWGTAGMPIAQECAETAAEFVASLMLHISSSGKSSMDKKVSDAATAKIHLMEASLLPCMFVCTSASSITCYRQL